MSIDFTTPALLFSTASLLLLAYTNRFLGITNVIRKLHADHRAQPSPIFLEEIRNLRRRVYLIRDMQTLGVSSLLMSTLCIGVLFLGLQTFGEIIFVLSLILMVSSLAISIWEIRISVVAIEIHLADIEKEIRPSYPDSKTDD